MIKALDQDAERREIQWMDSLRRRQFLLLLALLPAVLAVAFGWRFTQSNNRIEGYIAYVGKYRSAEFDRLHERALRLLLEEEQSGWPRVALKVFSLKNQEPHEIYGFLQKDPECIAVVDNGWGSDLIQAAPVIRNGTLPVISLNADKAGVDYGRHAVFLGHDDFVAEVAVDYLKQKHTNDYIFFIGEKSYWSTSVFVDGLSKELSLGKEQIRHVRTDEFNPNEFVGIQDQLMSSAEHAEKEGKRLVVLLNVHRDWGLKIIEWIDRSLLPQRSPFENAMIIGGTYIYSSPGEKEFVGRHGTQLLLITSPRDSLTPSSIRLNAELRKRFGDSILAGPSSGFYVQRCSHAIRLLQTMLQAERTDHSDKRSHRERLLAAFPRAEGSAWVLPSATLRFNTNLALIRPARLELRDKEGGTRSNPHQLSADGRIIPNVALGISVTDIRQINLDEGSFFAEFNLSIRYDRAYAQLLGDLGRRLYFPNSRETPTIESLQSLDSEPQSAYYRCIGKFAARFDLDNFPFDTQFLPIQVALRDREPQAVPSARGANVPIALSFDSQYFEGNVASKGYAISPGWLTEDSIVGVEESISYSGSDKVTAEGPVRLAQMTTVLSLRRSVLRPLATILLPLIGIGVCGIALLFLNNLALSNVGEISVGIFLALVAYAISFTSFAPNGSTITRADWLFWITATAVTVQLFLIIVGNACAPGKMSHTNTVRFIWIYRWLLAVAYLLGLALVYLV